MLKMIALPLSELAGSNEEPRELFETLVNEKTGVRTGTSPNGIHPFETLMKHPDYHQGMVMAVEAYDTEDEAKAGHERWAAMILEDKLPEVIEDCLNDKLAQLTMVLSGDKAKEFFTHRRFASASELEKVALKRLESLRSDNTVEGDTCTCSACNMRRSIFGAEPGIDEEKKQKLAARQRTLH